MSFTDASRAGITTGLWTMMTLFTMGDDSDSDDDDDDDDEAILVRMLTFCIIRIIKNKADRTHKRHGDVKQGHTCTSNP